MQFFTQIFSNRNIEENFSFLGPLENQRDLCDSCDREIPYGAFMSKDKIEPKIAINEAYVCEECYNKFKSEDEIDDSSDISNVSLSASPPLCIFGATIGESDSEEVFLSVDSSVEVSCSDVSDSEVVDSEVVDSDCDSP